MEIQGVVIGVVIVVSSAIILYLISLWGFREKTYDEVIAEQRQQNEAALAKSRVDKDKNKKKFKHKKGKGKSDESPPGSAAEHAGGDSESEHKMVEYELEPEVIEPAEIHPEKALKKLKKQQQPKPILMNREEKTYTRPVRQVEESFHPAHMPKDEVEMKHEHEQEQRTDEKKAKTKKTETRKVVVEEPVVAAVQQTAMTAPPPAPAAEGKKKKHRVDDPLELMSAVKSAPFNEAELQSMIDILLDRQGSSSQWMKKTQKGDPLTILKKQLEEKEQALADGQQQVASANNRLKELRQELTAEKTKNSAMEKRLSEKLATQTQEIQALHVRMKSTHEQHVAEVNTLKAAATTTPSGGGQYDGGQGAAVVQRLTEENRHYQETMHVAQQEVNSLKSQLQIIQTEMSNNVRNLTAADSARKAAEQKSAMKDDQVKRLEQTKEELTKQLHQYEHRANTLTKENETVAAQKQQLENECANMRNRLNNVEASAGSKVKDTEKALGDLQTQLASANELLAGLRKTETEKAAEITSLRQDNQRLAGELKVMQERPVAAPAPAAVNGDLHQDEATQKMLTDSQKEVEQLKLEVQTKATELNKLGEDLAAQTKKNNELRQKNSKVMEALTMSEKSAERAVQLKADVHAKNAELEQIKHDLDCLKNLNNELVQQVSTLSSQQSSTEELDKLRVDLNNKVGELTKVQAERDSKSSELSKATAELSAVRSSTQEELARLRVEKKNASAEVESVRQTLNNKVKDLQSEMQIMTREMARQSAELQSVREQTTQQSDDNGDALRRDLATSSEELAAAKAEMEALKKDNAELQEERRKLSESAAQNKELSNQLAKVQDVLAARLADVDNLKQELESQYQAKNALEEQYVQARRSLSESEGSLEEVARLQTLLETRDKELQSVKEQLDQGTKLSDESTDFVSKFRSELDSKLTEILWLSGELETQKRINIDLRQKNSVAMEALEKAEKAVKKDSTTDDTMYTQVLCRLFPDVSVSADSKSPAWLSSFEKEASDYLKQLHTKGSDTQQQESIEHYKAVLATTEDMLNKLQSSVESEEKKWQARLQDAENEHSRTRAELNSAREEMKQLRGSTEMEDRIKDLEERLQNVEKEKQDAELLLQKQLDEVKSLAESQQKSSDETIHKLRAELVQKSKESSSTATQVEEQAAASPAKGDDVGTSV